MKATTNGVMFKRYYSDPDFWPEETYHEDELIRVNGEDHDTNNDLMLTIKDGDRVELFDGCVFIAGSMDNTCAMPTHFKRWLKKQTTTVLVVEVAIDKADAMRETIKNAGGKVSA